MNHIDSLSFDSIQKPAHRFSIITLFQEFFQTPLAAGILGRAIEKNFISVDFANPRNYGIGRYRSVDDNPYGGGAGVIMRPDPIIKALESIERESHEAIILLSAAGTPYSQKKAEALRSCKHIIFICGRYEGVDHRITQFCTDEISIGDYILTGGEFGALIIIDSLARLIPGVVNNADSIVHESFSDGLLEYPQYTRPKKFRGMEVPEVLMSGNHQQIEKWRREQSIEITKTRRPDLLKKLGI